MVLGRAWKRWRHYVEDRMQDAWKDGLNSAVTYRSMGIRSVASAVTPEATLG